MLSGAIWHLRSFLTTFTYDINYLVTACIVEVQRLLFELNDMIRDLYLPKQSAKMLASRLYENLEPGTSVQFYCNREAALRKFFHLDGELVYCNDFVGFLLTMGLPAHDSSEWRLFIDSCKSGIKCVLLHNGTM